MSNDLKRVGLIFTEEGAVDFKKTLQDINLELNKNYNQFRLTQAQWDNSTKSTEKLKAHQEYLANAYEIQEDKVKTLRMQLADLENAEDKNTAAIKKKRNELTNAELKLKDYENKLKDIEKQLTNSGKKIEEFGTNVENIGGKIEKAGKKVSAFSVATGTALTACATSAIEFESAFTGVEKTVDGTEEQLAELKQGIRDMAKEIPSSTTEISAVAEAAGQLGIKTEDILSFTRVMIDLGNSTNLSAEEAASALAKFANITNMSAQDYSKLGATIVDLGNNFATTEADIVEMATRLAATGDLAGLSQAQILALATAMSSVGIEAEAGGSAMSKLLKQIQVAVETGSDDLQNFAKVAGMSADEFKKAFQKDAVKALSSFIRGLNDTKRNGKSAIAILEEMGLTEVRLSNTVLSLANANDVMTDAIDTASDAWKDNTALTNEANKRYDTLESKIKICLNKLKDFAITIGNKLMPSVEKVVDKIGDFADWLSKLSDEQVENIVNIGLMVTAIGPLLTILGKVTSTVGVAIKSIGTITQAIGVMKGTVTTTSTAVNGLAKVFSFINPTTIALTALIGVIAGLKISAENATKETKAFAEEMSNQKQLLDEYNKSIDDATNSNLAQIDSVDKLKDELSLLVNENGKVKEGYEGRVAFILNQLNEALGTEYKLNGDIVQSYKDLQGEIDETIKRKKAEIILNSEEEKYKNAIDKQTQAVEDLKKAHENLGMSIEEAKTKLQNLKDEAALRQNENGTDYWTYKEITNLENLINSYDDAEHRVKEYTSETQKYQKDYALFIEGKYDEISNTIIASTQEWTNSSLEEIKKSIDEQAKALEVYKKIYEDTGNEVALQNIQQVQQNLDELAKELTARTSTINDLGINEIDAWKTLATNSYDTYYDTISKLPPELGKKIQEMTGVTAERTPELVEETRKMSQQVLTEIENNDKFRTVAIENLKGMLNGLQDNDLRELLKEAGVENADKVIQGVREGNLGEEQGIDILSKLYSGLNNKNWKNSIYNTARNIASNLSNLLTVKATVKGATLAVSALTKTLPGHKNGLDYVPKDNYIARLHKGERVLTKEENKEYSQAEEQSKKINSNIFKNNEIDYNKMANAMLKALTGCKFTLDEDGFAKIVKDELYKVV